jgi:ferredoxin
MRKTAVENSQKTFTLPVTRPATSRYRNPIGKYVVKRNSRCISCGLCAELCPHGVHPRYENYSQPLRPLDYRCIGPSCEANDYFCVKRCPQQALTVAVNPIMETMGDYRWPAEMIIAHWYMAETGNVPYIDLEYSLGYSGGGFDKIRFKIPDPKDYLAIPDEEIDTSLGLNKRQDGRPQRELGLPVYGGGMSFGSTALPVLVGRARAAKRLNTLTCTGEGGYPEAFKPYCDNIITQVATGLFGVREETIKFAPVVEFKYAQGAKPGLGGHLLGDKVTPEVARIRETMVGNSLFSPFPFHSVYSVEDHKKHLDWIKEINPTALVSVKVSTPSDSDMVAIGSYYAGANIIHFDGSYGGTGAAPDIAKKNIAMPIEYAIPRVHRFLTAEGVRDEVCFIASGGIRSALDVAKAIALGADGCVIGTADLVAMECLRCSNCESGRGCARGIATTDAELGNMITEKWAEQRLVNMYAAWRKQWCEILRQYGLRSIKELTGRSDLLVHLDYLDKDERRKYQPAPEKKLVL